MQVAGVTETDSDERRLAHQGKFDRCCQILDVVTKKLAAKRRVPLSLSKIDKLEFQRRRLAERVIPRIVSGL
jgi:hypothetical protein